MEKEIIIYRCDFNSSHSGILVERIIFDRRRITIMAYRFGSTIKICDSDIFPNKGTRLNTSVCKCVTMHVENKTRYKVVFISSVLVYFLFSVFSFIRSKPFSFPAPPPFFFSAFFFVVRSGKSPNRRGNAFHNHENWIIVKNHYKSL